MSSYIGTLARYVENKVADYGTSVIMSAVSASPVGVGLAAASRFATFLETGGASEFGGVVSAQNFRFQGMELLEKVQEAILNRGDDGKDFRRKGPVWKRSPWANSRKQWLTEAWRHDWRSQPRDKIGRWIPGRLNYPVLSARRVGKGRQATSNRSRRLARYRRYGRAAARSIKINYGN